MINSLLDLDVYREGNTMIHKHIVDKIKELAIEVKREEAENIIEQHKKSRWWNTDTTKEDIAYSEDKKIFYVNKREDKKASHLLDNINNTFFVKIKGKDEELLKEITSLEKYITNHARVEHETEEERELNIHNARRFIRVNPYDKLGKSEYNFDLRERIVTEYKDKEGNSIDIKKGLLYKCDKCKSYEPLEYIEAVFAFNLKIQHNKDDKPCLQLTNIMIEGIECPVCNDRPDYNKVTYLGTSSRFIATIGKNVFNDLEEKGKITIGTVELKRSFFGDRHTQKTLSKKVVFNINSGRAYALPIYNIDTKKKKGRLEQIGTGNIHGISVHMEVPLKQVCEIGLLMEEYMRKNELVNEKAIIPFSTYIKNFANASKLRHRNIKGHEELIKYIDSVLNKEESDIKYSSENDVISSYEKLGLLVFYNQNPYINYSEYEDIARVKHFNSYNELDGEVKFPSKVRNIKRLRNTNLLKELNVLFDVKLKTEKKLLSESGSRLSAYMHLLKVKSVFKNKDNINKILIASEDRFKMDRRYNPLVDIDNNPYINRLIKEFGETAVANALVKDVMNIKRKVINESNPQSIYGRIERNDRYYYDTIRNYSDIITVYPDYKLPVNRLRLKELHDKIAKDASKIKNKEKFYNYEEKFMDMYDSKVIEDIEFKVALSNRKLADIGSQMGICVGGYWNRVEKGNLFIVTMQREGKYIGCLEISKNGELHQAKAKYNHRLEDSDLAILKEYCLMTNLTVDTCDVKDEYKVKKDKNKESVTYKDAIKITISSDVTEEDLLKEEVIEYNNHNDMEFEFNPIVVEMAF